jgi:filamentous hemagglutinin family protein
MAENHCASEAANFCLAVAAAGCFLILMASTVPAKAQVTPPITSSGLNTQISAPTTLPNGQINYNITGGTRPGGGSNLFQSFGNFNVPTNNIANFLNTGSIDPANPNVILPSGLPTSNILGRVTGGNISNIFGTIQTTNFGNANLFLMNPAGFLFGPNATVNVGGMMTFTTADYMRLVDGGRFNANPNAIPADLLTAAPVAAFGFLGLNPAAINFEGGQLTVGEGIGVTLVGGDINLVSDPISGAPSGITAPGRAIQLTSVAGPGEVAADTAVPTPGMVLGTVTLDQGVILSTAGDPSFGDGSGGPISIRGGQFVGTGAQILTSPAAGSAGSGGEMTVAVSGSATLADTSVLTNSNSAGSAGAVSITADGGLTMTNSFVDSSAIFALGDSGPVMLATNGPLSMIESFINTSSIVSGNAGAFTATGRNVTLDGVGVVADLFGDGASTSRSGPVTLTAADTVTVSGSALTTLAIDTVADGSPVKITGKTVNLLNGLIDASSGNGLVPTASNGGDIEIRGNNVDLTGFQLASFASGLPESTGKGGNIRFLGAENIQLTASLVNTSSTTLGGAGSIEFETQALKISNLTEVTSDTFGPGPGGTITVRGAENVTIESGSRVLTSADEGQGPAGNILFETQHLTMNGGSVLRSQSFTLSTGNAGSVTVQGISSPAESVLIDGEGSGIFTNTEGPGSGGNIFVNANSVTLQNGAQVTSSSTGPGIAGDITINAGNQFAMTNSAVTTEADQSSGGFIKISTNPNGTVQLTNSTISASVLDGIGGGGSVNIDPQYVVLQNSQILANAVQGPGGNISLTTNFLIVNNTLIGPTTPVPASAISASSQFGQQGTITIQSPIAPASGRILPLPQKPLLPTSLLTQRCAALASGEFSSFTMAGRDSLPAEPGSWLSSPLATLSGGTGRAANGEGQGVVRGERREAGGDGEGLSRISGSSGLFRFSGLFRSANQRNETNQMNQTNQIDQTDEPPVLSLRQIAPPGFLTQAFAADWSAGCTS